MFIIMVKIGIIGCGSIVQQRHAPETAANADAVIAGFCDARVERAEQMAEKFGGKAYKDYTEMLQDKNIDAVCVCVANKYHAPITIKALRAGKHVLCEKPMAVSIEQAHEMVKEADAAGRFLMIAHNQRFDKAHIKAKELIKSEKLGNIISFRTVFAHAGPERWSVDKNNSTWFLKKNEAFFGTVGDLGIHKADLIRWLIDDEIVEVAACVTTLDKKDSSGEPIEIDDNAFCILKSNKGIVGTIEASWTHYTADADNHTVINCKNGVVKIHLNPDCSVEVIKDNGEKIYIKTDAGESGVVEAFISSIKNNTPPQIDGREGLKALKIIFACIEASNSGRNVNITYPV